MIAVRVSKVKPVVVLNFRRELYIPAIHILVSLLNILCIKMKSRDLKEILFRINPAVQHQIHPLQWNYIEMAQKNLAPLRQT
ncbi:hypothetical protein D3C73_1375100 [compost metagenome]